MGRERHLGLLIHYREGQAIKEPVHVEDIGGGCYRLLYSPGFVQGLAAGDEFYLLNDDGSFEIRRRGGNLAIQVFSRGPVAPFRAKLVERVTALGGRLDGEIEHGLCFTIPLTAGFPAIEAVFNQWVAEHDGWEWYYGNVYDPVDGVTPLGWWN